MTNTKVIFFSMVFYLLYHVILVHSKANFDVYAKSLKYWVDKEFGYIANPKACKIQTSKKFLGGRVTCALKTLKRVDKFYIHVQLFYRYGTIYRNYLINYPQLEPCKLLSKPRHPDYTNPLADLIVLGLKSCCPLISNGCPYFPGFYNATNIDINATVAPFLPPVVPVGHYKIYGRFFIDGNRTIGESEGVGVVKANFENRVTDFSMLNMG